jgi:hypothetical protein
MNDEIPSAFLAIKAIESSGWDRHSGQAGNGQREPDSRKRNTELDYRFRGNDEPEARTRLSYFRATHEVSRCVKRL